jgi:hypothetical protein
MKYLVTVRRRDGGPAPPPEVLAGMLLTQRDWLQEKLDDGTFDVSYGFAQGGGGVGIVNADSGEQLSEIITGSPMFGLIDIDVQPLVGLAALEHAAHALRRGAAVPA